MILFLIFSILLAILASLFAIQNAVPVTVTYLNYRFEGSLAIIILASLLIGILVACAILIPLLIKKNWKISSLQRRVQDLKLNSETASEKPPASNRI